MNQKWKDAVGDIDETYIEEYASYTKKAAWKRWVPYEIAAACALFALVFGIWKYQSRQTGPESQGNIIVKQETPSSFFPEKKATGAPRASEDVGEPYPSASLQPTEEAVQDNTGNTVNKERENLNNNQNKKKNEKQQKNTYRADRDTTHEENSAAALQPAEESIQPVIIPEQNRQHSAKPEELPTQKPEETIAWNTVTAMAEPYGGRIRNVFDESDTEYVPTQIPAPKKSSPPELMEPAEPMPTGGNIYPGPGNMQTGHDSYEKEQALKQLKKKYGEAWLFYYEKEQRFTLERVLQLISEELRDELYMKLHSQDMTIYVIEVKTDKTTLQQADAEDEKSMFDVGTIVSKVNGVETYFMKDSYGKLCARFYKDGVLVTAWSENGKKEQMCEFINHMIN